jgi:integrase
MIPLPKYVRPVHKQNGRTFYYFEKFRRTVKQWPKIRMPDDPMSPEFIRRKDLIDRLDAVRDEKGWHWFFVDVSDRRQELPDPKDHAAFWAAVEKADETARKLLAGERKTFSALILEYKDSDAWKAIAESTQDQYSRHLDDINAAWGNDAVRDLTPEQAQRAIDSFKGTPAAGRIFRAVLSRLIGWGVPRGYRDDNPVLLTEKIGPGGTYRPWPDWAFELFFEYARIGLHLPVYSALYTGQRSVDVFKMTRPKPSAAEMPIVAQKTGINVPVQIHSEYRQIIDLAKADHVMLHLREDGQPWTQDGYETAWQRQMTTGADLYSTAAEREIAKAMLRLREHRIVFHGLRKNAVIMLLEVGCTEDEVGAIVGMSSAMVRHYALEVRKHKLAKNAMLKLENGWSEMRRQVLGAVGKPTLLAARSRG